jgi:hypothetical protein
MPTKAKILIYDDAEFSNATTILPNSLLLNSRQSLNWSLESAPTTSSNLAGFWNGLRGTGIAPQNSRHFEKPATIALKFPRQFSLNSNSILVNVSGRLRRQPVRPMGYAATAGTTTAGPDCS